MRVKSARAYRKWYKIEHKHISSLYTDYDENYIGCEYCKGNEEYVKGLFEMFHGDKLDIGNFLGNFLKIAEDGQAIYEFLQNAADCGSTLFYLFYNEKYFLAVNNGKAFNREGLHSLLNVAQSTKEDASQIGRFGIGFKLVHRLVGKGDGKEEIVNGLKGPMLFSWSKRSDLEALMNGEAPEDDDAIGDDSDLPYLLKLVLTNFPAGVGEEVKDISYKDRVLFPKEEYAEMSAYVQEQLTPYMDNDNFNQGSIFFIKLGEGKKRLLDDDYEKNFKVGVEYSLNTLRGLKNVKVNGTQIEEVSLVLEENSIEKGSDAFNAISPEYKDSDIHFSVGYINIDFSEANPFLKIEALKDSPTFYKYFPLADEMHKSALFVHCDSFSNEANRRKLHSDSINKALFPQIAKFVIGRMEEYKHADWNKYCQLYANALLCETPNGNSEWLGPVFFNLIKEYLKENIPTKGGVCSTNCNHVCIRRVKSAIADDKEVRGDIEWFLWDEENVGSLTRAAASKLKVSYVRITDLIQRCDKNRIREWVARHHNSKEYTDLMVELCDKDNNLYSIKQNLLDTPLFAFSNGKVYSFNESVQVYNSESKYKYTNLIFTTDHTIDVKDILQKIGLVVSETNIDQYPKLKTVLPLPKDKSVFDMLIAQLAQGNTLDKNEKERLIRWLCGPDKLDGIADESIKRLNLYKNAVGEFKELGDLISADINVPQWLRPYQIDKAESSPILKQYQIDASLVYASVICKHWENITSTINSDAKEFYSTVKRYYEADATNSKTLQSGSYIRKQDGTFVKADGCFYSSLLPKDRTQYLRLNNAIKTLLGDELPDYSIVEFLSTEPFKTDDDHVTDYSIEDGSVDDLDMKALVDFAIANKDNLFTEFVVVKDGEFWTLQDKTSGFSQVYTNSNPKRKFIEEHCKDSMSLLPSFLSEHKDEKGILSGDELDEYILETIEDDVDELSEELLLVLNQEGRQSMLSRLDEVEFDLDKEFGKDSYEFRLVKTAMSLSDDGQEEFRNKLVVIKDGERYEYNQIPPSVENVHVEGAKKNFDLSELLPNERHNSNLRNELVMKFNDPDINQEKLKALFEVTNDCDVADVFEQLKSNYEVLENTQQLAFALLMSENEGGIDCFKAESREQEKDTYAIDKTFYIKAYPFISSNSILAKKYSDLSEYVKLPIGEIYYEPYITEDNEFVCEQVSDELDDKAKASLLTFIDKLRQKHKNLSNVSFDKIGGEDVKNILGFNPKESIAVAKYALEEEELPQYVHSWLKENADRKNTLVDLGVSFDDCEVIRLRRYLGQDLQEFEDDDIVKIDQSKLERTLEWLGKKPNSVISDEDRYDVFVKVVERINKLRKYDDIVVSDGYDFERLQDESEEYESEGYEEWNEETGYSIMLFDGEMPKSVSIGEFIDGTVWKYNSGNYVTDEEGVIYVNKQVSLMSTLLKLVDDGELNKVNLEEVDVYKLFSLENNSQKEELERLRKENERLRQDIKNDGEAIVGPTRPDDIEKVRQWEAQLEAQKRLIQEFPQWKFPSNYGEADNDGKPYNFSTIEVVDEDDTTIPVVLKSYKKSSEPFKINTEEWDYLIREQAVLLIYTGKDVKRVYVRDLIRKQSCIAISFSTENLDIEDKVNAFADSLHYFNELHFDFDSFNISTRVQSAAELYKRNKRAFFANDNTEDDI